MKNGLILLLYVCTGFVSHGVTMFTSEFNFDGTVITLMDEEDNFPDVVVELCDEYVFIKQYNDEDYEEAIIMSVEQWDNLLDALKLPEGTYKTEERK